MNRHRISGLEMLLLSTLMLAVVIAATLYAWHAWLEHYA